MPPGVGSSWNGSGSAACRLISSGLAGMTALHSTACALEHRRRCSSRRGSSRRDGLSSEGDQGEVEGGTSEQAESIMLSRNEQSSAQDVLAPRSSRLFSLDPGIVLGAEAVWLGAALGHLGILRAQLQLRRRQRQAA